MVSTKHLGVVLVQVLVWVLRISEAFVGGAGMIGFVLVQVPPIPAGAT